ncbi:MAG: hypothetical protein LUH15_13875 [Tannerellaceae bacterium]|nr:hypothetical protein [Tannerellaceae bacterium]
MAGIAPLAPGYRTAAVLPRPGLVEEVTAVVPTIRGEIKNSFRNHKKQFNMETTIPPRNNRSCNRCSGRESPGNSSERNSHMEKREIYRNRKCHPLYRWGK